MARFVLGQVNPSATTDTTLYTVASLKSTVCSSILIANRNVAGIKYRIAIRPAGASISGEHYIAYDCYLPGNSSDEIVVGITLAAGDVVTVRSDTANVSFNMFGDESA